MHKLILGVAAAMLLTTGVANADAISDRQAAMKKNGGAIGPLVKIMKGEMDYDPATVLASFTTMREDMDGFENLFPEDSMTGGDTTASPKIWEDMDGFKAAHAKFDADVEAAIAANPQDLAAFQAVFGTVAGNCGACHQAYRL